MKVHEFLDEPSKWTQSAYARDKDGAVCDLMSADAVCWCLSGAIRKCYGAAYHDVWLKAANIMEKTSLYRIVGTWNDRPERKYEEVHAFCVENNI